MWEFAHLSDHFKDINSLDLVPRTAASAGVAGGRLFIGGIGALHEEPDPLPARRITHVLSVLDHDVREKRPLTGYRHLWLQVEDSPEENLLRHFEKTNAFIASGLKSRSRSSQRDGERDGGEGDGGVFVHCAMGVSRSATIVCAYLMWEGKCSTKEALEQLREGRSCCRPNDGFMKQLEVYEKILRAESEGERESIYGEWVKQQYSHDRERLEMETRRSKL
ncbi:phosphatases II [Dissoconium aciculare CBS 342.82]|jgi:dual specificity phosphatase 12|uniref:protein-tyrosine-phosphatase n=1 Tax=Dissoconium aciculare CBS 342.82 TaxID=1314786 RepID=A0A6J3M5I5_9PEZI|nr:phosphatases II [Dissoconium aciculare CBS 342.82]KAF1823143.1 phosphatases II [Dissoconium aciculare CBS 342.82]